MREANLRGVVGSSAQTVGIEINVSKGYKGGIKNKKGTEI